MTPRRRLGPAADARRPPRRLPWLGPLDACAGPARRLAPAASVALVRAVSIAAGARCAGAR